MAFSLLGLSTAVPPHTMSGKQATQMSDDCVCRTDRQRRTLRALQRRSQIERRHLCVPHEIAYQWVPVRPSELSTEDAARSQGPTTAERMRLYADHAGPLAVAAATRALRKSRVSAAEITHLVTVSCTGFEAPGVDVELIDQLELPGTVERLHIGFMGCHGALNALRATLGLTTADPAARVLVSATELCSLHFGFTWDTERILGNVLFADGSAALVGADPLAVREDGCWQVVATGSCRIPDSRHAITWRIGDHGFEMSLSSDVPDLIKTHLPAWLSSWLDRQGLGISDVGSWAIHPGGPRIVDAVEECLELPSGAAQVSRDVLRSYGNMSSPTVLFVLEQLQRQADRLPCVALGFGPGLFAEAALLR